jgi:hypothetical protein
MITIYEGNIWERIIHEHHPRYIPLNDFTVSLNIQDIKYANALEADPLLHQKLIDNLNDFVNSKTYVYLSNKVFKTELNVRMHINNRDYDALTKEYREFDVFMRYLLSITNENLKQLVRITIESVAKDKKAVARYQAGIGFKMVLKIAGIGFSLITLSVGTASLVASPFTAGVTSSLAIAALIIGFTEMIQSSCELARDIIKTIETLEMARIEAVSSLKGLEQRYSGNSNLIVGVRDVLGQAVNKILDGVVEVNTIKALSGKFDIWEKKIQIVDQKCHKLARNLNTILLEADKIKRVINMASRPPLPSKEGITIKVPPPVPPKANRPSFNSRGQQAPPRPSSRGRVSTNALRDIYSNNTAHTVPSRHGRMSVPSSNTTPNSHTRISEQLEHSNQINKKKNQLNMICLNVKKTILEIPKLQFEVRANKRENALYKNALKSLKGRKSKISEFVEAFANVAVDLTKAGINVGLGAHGLYSGLADTSRTTTSAIHSIGSFVVERIVESAQLSYDLTEGIGELGAALKEKDEIDNNRRRKQSYSV